MRMIKISDHPRSFYDGDYYQAKDWGGGQTHYQTENGAHLFNF